MVLIPKVENMPIDESKYFIPIIMTSFLCKTIKDKLEGTVDKGRYVLETRNYATEKSFFLCRGGKFSKDTLTTFPCTHIYLLTRLLFHLGTNARYYFYQTTLLEAGAFVVLFDYPKINQSLYSL